jgi:hypothetical protein
MCLLSAAIDWGTGFGGCCSASRLSDARHTCFSPRREKCEALNPNRHSGARSCASFDAQLRIRESITTTGNMDSGPTQRCVSRNDGGYSFPLSRHDAPELCKAFAQSRGGRRECRVPERRRERRRPSARGDRSRVKDPPCDSPHAPGAAASTASHPAFVTIMIRPSVGETGRRYW